MDEHLWPVVRSIPTDGKFIFAETFHNPSLIFFQKNVTFVTGRNKVLAKVMFLQASVILSTGGGVSAPGGCQLQIFGGRGSAQNFGGVSGPGRVSAPNFGGVCSGGCLPPNLGGCLLCGGCLVGGVCSKFGGVSAPNFQGGLLQILGGGSAQNFRGVWSGGVCSKFGGVSAPGGCLDLGVSAQKFWGGVCSKFLGGVSAPNF